MTEQTEAVKVLVNRSLGVVKLLRREFKPKQGIIELRKKARRELEDNPTRSNWDIVLKIADDNRYKRQGA